MRIVTLAPSNLEMVASLQADIEIVGIEDSSDWPEEICAKAKRLGPDLNPDLEAVASLSPDLVVASLSVPGMERVVTGLRALGLPTLVLASRSISEVQSDLLRLGELLAATHQASKVVDEMNQRIAAVQQQRLPGPALPVYLEW